MLSDAYKSALIGRLMRNVPIPGRYLERLLRAADIDMATLPAPGPCYDRWNEFQIDINGFDTHIKKHIYFQGYFEWAETQFVRTCLRKGQTFVDVGANIGWHSLVAANRVGPSGRVIAFEPVQRTFAELESNIRLNRLSHVTLNPLALSDSDGTIAIYGNKEGDSGGNTMFGGADRVLLEQIKTRRGDDVLSELSVDVIDLLKVDVEGAEMHVLRGLERFFSERRIKAMMLEVNAAHLYAAGTSPKELIDFVSAQGFSVADIRKPGEALRTLPDDRAVVNICCRQITRGSAESLGSPNIVNLSSYSHLQS